MELSEKAKIANFVCKLFEKTKSGEITREEKGRVNFSRINAHSVKEDFLDYSYYYGNNKFDAEYFKAICGIGNLSRLTISIKEMSATHIIYEETVEGIYAVNPLTALFELIEKYKYKDNHFENSSIYTWEELLEN